MKIEDVGSFGMAVQALFDINYLGVTTMDPTLGGTFEVDTFDVQLADVIAIVGTGGMRGEGKDETASMRLFMKKVNTLALLLKFKVEVCIGNGSITVGYNSFGISALLKSIVDNDIDAFHSAYLITYGQITVPAIKTALIASGFVAAKITAIKANHDIAYGFNSSKIILKGEISELSSANRLVIKTFLALCARIIKSIRLYAVQIGDNDLKRKATQKALSGTVAPAPVKKPRDKHFTAMQRRLLYSALANRDTCQFTFVKGTGVMTVGRSLTKDGIPSVREILPLGIKVSKKKSLYAGEGEYFIFEYVGEDKALVRTFIIKQ